MNLIQHLKPKQAFAHLEVWKQKTVQWLNLQKTAQSPDNTLHHLRNKIDTLDHNIIQLFAHRMQVAEAIGNYKKQQKLSPHQPQRWAEVKALRINKATQLGLSEEFVENMLELIHQESLKRQVL